MDSPDITWRSEEIDEEQVMGHIDREVEKDALARPFTISHESPCPAHQCENKESNNDSTDCADNKKDTNQQPDGVDGSAVVWEHVQGSEVDRAHAKDHDFHKSSETVKKTQDRTQNRLRDSENARKAIIKRWGQQHGSMAIRGMQFQNQLSFLRTLANQHCFDIARRALNEVFFQRSTTRRSGVSSEGDFTTTDIRNARKLADKIEGGDQFPERTASEVATFGLQYDTSGLLRKAPVVETVENTPVALQQTTSVFPNLFGQWQQGLQFEQTQPRDFTPHDSITDYDSAFPPSSLRQPGDPPLYPDSIPCSSQTANLTGNISTTHDNPVNITPDNSGFGTFARDNDEDMLEAGPTEQDSEANQDSSSCSIQSLPPGSSLSSESSSEESACSSSGQGDHPLPQSGHDNTGPILDGTSTLSNRALAENFIRHTTRPILASCFVDQEIYASEQRQTAQEWVYNWLENVTVLTEAMIAGIRQPQDIHEETPTPLATVMSSASLPSLPPSSFTPVNQQYRQA